MIEHADTWIGSLTFALAIMGFAGLTWLFHASLHGQRPRWLHITTVLIIVVHVFMVWAWRYDWQLGLAVRNGYVGFVIFHLALIGIVSSLFFNHRMSRYCIYASFVIVSMGATGATLRYGEVSFYFTPVVLLVGLGVTSLAALIWQRWRSVS